MPKWRLEKSFTFEAAHRLPHHDGKCQRLHGHSFRGKIILEDYELITTGSKVGMVIDYTDISETIKSLWTTTLDHQYLNETTGLESPTSELLAKFIFEKLKPELPTLICVRVEETCTSSAEYWG